MNFLQILQTILNLAPDGITLTHEVVAVVQEIESALKGVPAESHPAVVTAAAKALIADSVRS